MRRIRGIGEGAILGAVICAMLAITAVSAMLALPEKVTVLPIHQLDVVVTPEPLININTATAEDISSLKGIGDVLAERIVAWREENGPFDTVEDMTRVPGIGDAKLNDIRDRITVE